MHFAKLWRALVPASLVCILAAAASAAPAITDVLPPADGTYGGGFLVYIRVEFSEPVTLTGSPTLVVRIGGVDRQFGNAYTTQQPNELSFPYQPRTGDDGSLNITGPILLNGGTIKGNDGADASLAFTPKSFPAVVFDMTPPPIPVVNAVSPASPTFEQPFTVSGTAQAGSTVYVGTPDERILFNGPADANGNWSVTVNRQPPGTYTFDVKATDAVGNASAPAHITVTVQYDPPTPGVPTITQVDTPSPGIYNGSDTSDAHGVMSIGIHFSEPLIVTGNPTLMVRIGSTDVEFPGYLNGSLLLFQSVPPPGLEGTLAITGPIKLNGGSIKGRDGDDAVLSFTPVNPSSVYIDTKPPAPPTIGGVTPASPTSDQSFTVFGTADPGSRVWFWNRTGGSATGPTTADANGNWAWTFPPRAPGDYTLLVSTEDEAGNNTPSQRLGVAGIPVTFTVQPTSTGDPPIASQPASSVAGMGLTTTFAVATSATNPTFQWQYDGATITSATGSTLQIGNTAPASAGLYTAMVSAGGNVTMTAPAILGLASGVKLLGSAQEVGSNIVHPNGNIYDQILLQGPAATLMADPGQVTRASWVDLTGDIVQVEFSGAGTLSVVLDGPTGPAVAANYNQPNIAYMKGHAGLVIAGANETTNVSVFSVGRITAVDQSIFRSEVNYDGIADLAFLAILSANGNFGGIRAGNASFWSTNGCTGIYAPNVRMNGPVYVGEIDARGSAVPVLLLGPVAEVQIAGGDLAQTNGRAVQVSGLARLRFVAGTTSQGIALPAQPCRGRLEENGSDVTAQLASP